MADINSRIDKLRNIMKEKQIDGVLVMTDDYHLSEYVGSYFKEREYISGFTGSQGKALITLDKCKLFTDGRYFLQAEEELKNTYFTLQKEGNKNYKSLLEQIKDYLLRDNFALAVDFKTLPYSFAKSLEEFIESNNLSSSLINEDLVSLIWEDRPSLVSKPIFLLPLKYSGESYKDKLTKLLSKMEKDKVDTYLLTSLESICYLFNIRGDDIEFTPVCYAYSVISKDRQTIYLLNKDSLDNKVKKYFLDNDIEVKDYFAFYDDVASLISKTIALDKNNSNYQTVKVIDNQVNKVNFINDYVIEMKAIKNEIEIKNFKKAHLYDAVAVIKLLIYLKTNKEYKDELSIAKKLEDFRKEQPTFIESSFATICGFGPHGAIVHYEATEETNVEVTDNNLLLIDSGGHYLYGTTDITRTVVLGKISNVMKKHFTLVLKSHIALASTVFKEGLSGSIIDYASREILYKNHLDYNHGTGHGVGYLLSVHEGPQNISCSRFNSHPIYQGMITSDEPGLYLKDNYGIRHENLLLCVNDHENEFGKFLKFVPLTLVPFDLDGIDKKLLTQEEKDFLNNYHSTIYSKVSKYLSIDEAKILKTMTRKI